MYIWFGSTDYTEWQVPLSDFLAYCAFHHDGKISPGWWGGVCSVVHAYPLSLYLPSRTKLWCMLQLRGLIHSPCPYFSTPLCSVFGSFPPPPHPPSPAANSLSFLVFLGVAIRANRVQYRGRGEIGGVPALSAEAYTTTFLVMVDWVKEGERTPPTLTRLGW